MLRIETTPDRLKRYTVAQRSVLRTTFFLHRNVLMPSLTRRGCLLGIAGAGLAVTARPIATRGERRPTNLIDAHVHVWSPDTSRFPLAPGFSAEDLWFPSYSAEEVRRLAAPAGVTRFNLVQMTWYGLDHSYILSLIADDPRHFVGTGIVPAVIRYSLDFCPGAARDGIHGFLLTAAAIGGLIKYNASISGAEVGCQGEVGSASAMAAAGLAAAGESVDARGR